MPLGKGAARRLDQNARNYLILDGLLFKILDDGEGSRRAKNLKDLIRRELI